MTAPRSRLPRLLSASSAIARLGAVAGLGLLGGCTYTPDPCAGYKLACLSVTVESGPPQTAQLLVRVLDGYGSTTPNTPRRIPDKPLTYPLRFAIRFGEFDPFHRGKVTVELTAIDRASETLGQVQREVAIDGLEKVAMSLSIGAPFDMTADQSTPPDLRSPPSPDLGAADLAVVPDGP